MTEAGARENLTAIMWKNQYVKKLMKMYSPPAQCNFCDKHGKTLKSATVPTVQDYITHMGYVVADGPGN